MCMLRAQSPQASRRGELRAVVLLACVAGLLLAPSSPAGQESAAPAPPAQPPTQVLRSPDESIDVSISVGGPLSYSVRVDGQPLVAPSRLGLRLRNGTVFGRDVELVSANHQTNDTTWENRLGKRRNVRDHHNQLQLLLRERSAAGRTFEVVFRAFNDGIAYRYELLSQPGMRDFVLEEELTQFAFPA